METYDDVVNTVMESAAAHDPMFGLRGADAIGLTDSIRKRVLDYRNSKAFEGMTPAQRDAVHTKTIESSGRLLADARRYELSETFRWAKAECERRSTRNLAELASGFGRRIDTIKANNSDANGNLIRRTAVETSEDGKTKDIDVTDRFMLAQIEPVAEEFANESRKAYAGVYAAFKGLGIGDADAEAAATKLCHDYVVGALNGYAEGGDEVRGMFVSSVLGKYGTSAARFVQEEVVDEDGKPLLDKDGNKVVAKDDDGNPIVHFNPAGGLWMDDGDVARIAAYGQRAKDARERAAAAAAKMGENDLRFAKDSFIANAESIANSIYIMPDADPAGRASAAREKMRKLMQSASVAFRSNPDMMTQALNGIQSAFSSAASMATTLESAMTADTAADAFTRAQRVYTNVLMGREAVVDMPVVLSDGSIATERMDANKARVYLLSRMRSLSGISPEAKRWADGQLRYCNNLSKLAELASDILNTSVVSEEGDGVLTVDGSGYRLTLAGANTHENSLNNLEYKYRDAKGKTRTIMIAPQMVGRILRDIERYGRQATVVDAAELKGVIDAAAEEVGRITDSQQQQAAFAAGVSRRIGGLFSARWGENKKPKANFELLNAIGTMDGGLASGRLGELGRLEQGSRLHEFHSGLMRNVMLEDAFQTP